MPAHFTDGTTPGIDALSASDLAQLRAVIGLAQGRPDYDGPVDDYLEGTLRYDVLLDGVHRYDAWVVGGWLPCVVFETGASAVAAWWSDQDSRTEGFADADDVWAAYEAAMAERSA